MIESNTLTPEWKMMLEQYFDYCLIPDPYFVDIYKQSGLNIPVNAIELGSNLKPFLDYPIKSKKNHIFKFICLSSLIERKNHITLIKAFKKSFHNNPFIKLIIHSRSSDQVLMNELLKEVASSTNIEISFCEKPQELYISKLLEADCLINVSKGEGFPMEPREAMAAGIPVICTNNTAQTSICKTELVKVVKSEIKEPAYLWYVGKFCGDQFNCSIDDVAEAMIDVYDNYEFYLSKGAEARKFAAKYTHYKFAERLLNFLEKIH